MKKIVRAVLCLVIALFMFVGCAEDIIGEYMDQYEKPTKKENITLNLYIICDPATTGNALDTVRERIKTYTSDNYGTTLNVIYCSDENYAAKITEKTAAGATDHADIFLINSESMFNSLYAAGRLADITTYLNGTAYGTLNSEITDSLIDASAVLVDGKSANYCVPNNHVVGQYKYLVIDKEIARKYYYSDEVLKTYTSIEALQNDENANLWKDLVDDEIDPSQYIYYEDERVMYEDKAVIEADGNICNISVYPTATKADVYSSAFAISANSVSVERSMEMIYAINKDTDLCNYLQYGILGTNYLQNEDDSIVRVKDGVNDYIMNPLYTGNIFKMLYCEELEWLPEDAANGTNQNRESIYAN